MLAYVTTYSVLKAVHVLAAVIWVGGGIGLTITGFRAQRSKDPQRLATVAREAEFLGLRVFTPTSLLLLLFGVGAMLTDAGKAQWDWSQAWLVVGMVIFALSFVIGAGFLGPTVGKYNELLAERGFEDGEVQALLDRILLVARLDVLLLVLAVLDMVVKPGGPTP